MTPEARQPSRPAAGEAPAAATDPTEVVDGELVEDEAGPPPVSPKEGEVEAVDEGESVEADLDELLADTQRQRDEYLDLAQRTKADFENYRKRVAAEVTAAGTRARTELGSGLVSVIDNLEHALTAAGIDPAAALDGGTKAEGELEQGIALTYRELASVLARAGIQPYDPTGEAFDPTWHEALQTRPGEDVDPGTVVEVLQKGYRLDEQVVRAARVVVSE